MWNYVGADSDVCQHIPEMETNVKEHAVLGKMKKEVFYRSGKKCIKLAAEKHAELKDGALSHRKSIMTDLFTQGYMLWF